MKQAYYGIILMVLVTATGMKCVAQSNDKSTNKQIMQQSQEAVDAIAMYPTDTRKIIFEACEYPELITQLSAKQKITQKAFTTLISSFKQDEQEKIWNLTRYDGLISDLAAYPKKTEAEINAVLLNYPQEIRKSALEEQKKNYDLLVQIDKMNQSYESDFESSLSTYYPEAKNVFQKMIQMPEVLSILNENMQYTVLVGNYYKKNSERILHKTDSLNYVLTQKNIQDVDDWKQSMNADPKAQKEYIDASQEYAQENGYQSDDYNAVLTPDVTDYSLNPYDWWLGYPSWYPHNSWNPYPYWYDWGFYFGAGRRAVFFGLPSAYFMDWFFYHPEHFSRYAELSNNYYNYYDKHRESMNYNSISRRVNDWRSRNKDIVTNDWDIDKSNRVERFREYAQMEVNWKKYNSKNQKQKIKRSAYIQRTSSNYYFLSSDISNRQLMQKNSRTSFVPENVATPVKRPAVIIPDRLKAGQQPTYVNPQPNNNGTRPENTNIQARSSNSSRQVVNSNQMRNAQQYQQNTWTQQPKLQPKPKPDPRPRPEPQQIRTSAPSRQPVQQNSQPSSNGRRK
jgi:hypothetical protein